MCYIHMQASKALFTRDKPQAAVIMVGPLLLAYGTLNALIHPALSLRVSAPRLHSATTPLCDTD
jgi:hypothetical protein